MSLHLEGERRHLTVMFTDLVDFTVMGERLGEESVFSLTRRIVSEQGQAIQSNGGVVQDFAGDGLMAVFGAPVAMEDAALRACRTALDIQERMYRLQDEFQASFGVKPQLRIGIHTGPAVVGKIGEGKTMSYSALGDTVNVASRLQAAADPGSVCITRATLDVVEGFVDATPLGERQFKGNFRGEHSFCSRTLWRGGRQKCVQIGIGQMEGLQKPYRTGRQARPAY